MKLVEMTGITKVYENGVLANELVDFDLESGEIHAIAGENGAGKSTVMKMLYGLEKPNAGVIRIRGEIVRIESPLDAVKQKIGYVHQHFMLVNELNVYENIYLGFELSSGGILKRKRMRDSARELAERFGMQIDVNRVCSDLSVGEAQKVEILKALSRGAEILILDEPTAVLTPQECEELFAQLESLRRQGCSIVIITHRLKEIKRLCDRITILRKGKDCGTYAVKDVTEEEISRLMVGSDVQLDAQKTAAVPGEEVLCVRELTITRLNKTCAVSDVNFSVRSGEIVCIAGVEGNGQREVIASVTGLYKRYAGTVEILGRDIKKLNVKSIRGLSVSHIPEDRMTTGADVAASIYDNLISVAVQNESRAGLIPHRKLRERAEEQVKTYDVRADGVGQTIGMLSGGNMQKVVVAREFWGNPKLIVADQPTRGVDVGAIEFIHKRLLEKRDAGCAILLLSADLSEVFQLADRILIFHKGEITAHITDPQSVTEEQLGRYMLGIERQTK